MHDPIMSEWRGSGPLSVGGGWLVDEWLFAFLVDLEIQKAQRLRYSLSLVCFAVEGNGESVVPAIAEHVTRYLRATDAVTIGAGSWLALLLVDAESTHLPLILHRLTTHLETNAWSAGGSCYPRTASRGEDMLRQAVDLMDRAKVEGGNRLYVAS
jgi:hypothetical protein